MKTFSKNIFFVIISLIIVGIVFSGGFFIGRDGGDISAPGYFNGAVNASNDIDFAPFWKTWDLIEEKYIPASTTIDVSEQDRVYGAIKGMVDSLDDPYTTFLLPVENEQFNTTINGEFSGVGMEVGIEEDVITVIAPLKSSPAESAGVEAGDKVLGIDGVPTFGLSLNEAVDLIRGERGTVVLLSIGREGIDTAFDIEITRDTINIPTLDTEIVDDVFIISLYNFSANVTTEFRTALREFVSSKKHKLILDLRGNPGGFLDAAIDISSWFLPVGKPIVSEDFGDSQKVFRSKGYDIFNDNLRMVILTNKGSASASEIVAGALQEHGVAEIVGTETFGKGSVQELIPVTPETSLKVTIAQWLTPDGRSISDGGLTPDHLVNSETEGVKPAGEPDAEGIPLYEMQMNRAMELLR